MPWESESGVKKSREKIRQKEWKREKEMNADKSLETRKRSKCSLEAKTRVKI